MWDVNTALPLVQLVDAKGEMTKETPWAGMFCKKADKEVLRDLETRGLLFSAPVFEHSYPHCWRCGTPLIYYARDSWFIKMTEVKQDLIRNNNTVNWVPESIGKGRFGDWLENVQDWGNQPQPLLGHAAEYLGMRVRSPPFCRQHRRTEIHVR